MESDAQIRDDVISELAWDPQVPDAEGIGVNVSDGAVALAGRTPTYAAKLAAARAAERVHGVRAVADDLEVHLGGDPRDDSRAEVSDRTAKLYGHVHTLSEASAARAAAAAAPGVAAVEDHLTVTP
jgi:osmotically-inducible protein OsmY